LKLGFATFTRIIMIGRCLDCKSVLLYYKSNVANFFGRDCCLIENYFNDFFFNPKNWFFISGNLGAVHPIEFEGAISELAFVAYTIEVIGLYRC